MRSIILRYEPHCKEGATFTFYSDSLSKALVERSGETCDNSLHNKIERILI